MTTIPTWLAVLVPVLAAAVSGSAALIGAVMGRRSARELEQRPWTRERRERAYLAVLEARNRFVGECTQLSVLASLAMSVEQVENDSAKETFRKATYIDGPRTLAAAKLALHKTVAGVELFGSAAALKTVSQWMAALDKAYGLVAEMDGGRKLEQAIAEEVRLHRDPFLALVRKELGVGN